MDLAGKVLVGALAVVGGAVVGSVIASRFITVALYSPYLPQYDIIAINGRTLWGLIARGGGESPPEMGQGLPFPIGLRVYWFKKKPSIAEHAYESITGRTFQMTDLLGE
jgi:hypothetical protein